MLAGKLLLEGGYDDEVAESVGVSLSSVKRWRRAVEEGGLEALRAHLEIGVQNGPVAAPNLDPPGPQLATGVCGGGGSWSRVTWPCDLSSFS